MQQADGLAGGIVQRVPFAEEAVPAQLAVPLALNSIGTSFQRQCEIERRIDRHLPDARLSGPVPRPSRAASRSETPRTSSTPVSLRIQRILRETFKVPGRESNRFPAVSLALRLPSSGARGLKMTAEDTFLTISLSLRGVEIRSKSFTSRETQVNSNSYLVQISSTVSIDSLRSTRWRTVLSQRVAQIRSLGLYDSRLLTDGSALVPQVLVPVHGRSVGLRPGATLEQREGAAADRVVGRKRLGRPELRRHAASACDHHRSVCVRLRSPAHCFGSRGLTGIRANFVALVPGDRAGQVERTGIDEHRSHGSFHLPESVARASRWN